MKAVQFRATNMYIMCMQAEQKMLEANYNKEYLPIEGLAEFRKATIDLMLGPNSKAQQEVRGSRPRNCKLRAGAPVCCQPAPLNTSVCR
jgi:aspartate/tyrosine/aromatic aminotransferase